MKPYQFFIRLAVVCAVLGLAWQSVWTGFFREPLGDIFYAPAMLLTWAGVFLAVLVPAITPSKWFWGDR